MPDVTISIGGRNFIVACQEGEEQYLHSAASLLDREAQSLASGGARLTQERMLLMAGLLLADKALSTEEELKSLEARLSQQAALIDELQDRPAPPPERIEVEVQVPTLPEGTVARLSSLADQAEAIAQRMEG